MSRIVELIIKHEGRRLKPYRCSQGKLTIGYGRNLDDNGISEAEAMNMLDNDILETIESLQINYSWFRILDSVRADAIMDMCYQLGFPTLNKFKKMIAAIHSEDFEEAAVQALDSRWARQTPVRANEIAYMIRTGKYQE